MKSVPALTVIALVGTALLAGSRSSADQAATGRPSIEQSRIARKLPLAAEGADIEATDLPAGSLGAPETLVAAALESRWTLKELTDAYISETLRRAGGNRSLAARRLGVSRKFLWERERK